MSRKVILGVVLAAAVLAIIAVVVYKPSSSPTPTTTQTSSKGGKVYLYSMKIEGGGETQQFVAYFIPVADGLIYGQKDGSTVFIKFGSDGVINLLSSQPNVTRKATYYSGLLEICINSTTSAKIAGESLTLTSRQCSPFTSPLPTAKTFDELVLALYGLPVPGQWKRSGSANTPLGQAAVYTNTTELPVMPGLNAVLNYEKWLLNDGTVYLFKIQLAYGTQVAATLTYTFQNTTGMAPELQGVIDELSRAVVATNGGGLQLLNIAEKIGMKYDGKWPAVIIFFDLQCPYCAMLFKYNSTLFEGHRLVLLDLVVHPAALPDHERLRCLYQSNPAEVIPTLRVVYDRFLANDPNYTGILPQRRCPIDTRTPMELAQLLAGQNVGTPMIVVVYPNGTYNLVVGYDPNAIAAALKG